MAVDFSALDTVIGKRMEDLAKPGVLSVRPGFKVTGDWLTPTPSIVVTVAKKTGDPPAADRLPDQVEGVPVDVREASERKRLELRDPDEYARQLRLTPDAGAVPHFPGEQVLAEAPGAPAGTAGPAAVAQPRAASAHARLAALIPEATKPHLDYTGPPGVTLDPVEADATILLSASPDAGWPVLRDFLAGTAQSLTVGLYDFTSAHILNAVETGLAGRRLTLVLDHPPRNPTADQTDAAAVAALRQALGDGFTQAWALTRTDPDATAWIFPTAYHIKVAVRDRAAFWLSSGNWNNSNQPDIDPAGNPADAEEARHRDRDWHVVISQPQLAGVFEDYIRHDLSVAETSNKPPEQPGPPPQAPGAGGSRTGPFGQFFPSTAVSGRIKITPLLTPDPGVYAGAVRDFIAAAAKTLYMQFQYIEPPRAGVTNAQGFGDLIGAVVARQNAGVDVKVIMSEFETAGYLEQLQGLGLDVVNNVKIQNNVHNKGIVIDGAAVMVSSQNWSADGTLRNRDAGVIIDHEGAAQYFQQIFLHDWEHLATRKARSD